MERSRPAAQNAVSALANVAMLMSFLRGSQTRPPGGLQREFCSRGATREVPNPWARMAMDARRYLHATTDRLRNRARLARSDGALDRQQRERQRERCVHARRIGGRTVDGHCSFVKDNLVACRSRAMP